jgi:hypothetical protein
MIAGRKAQFTWAAPAVAVDPANHFHTRVAAGRDEILRNEAFGELLGGIAELSNLASRMTARLEGIRRDFPDLWDVWQKAMECEPTKEDMED